MNNKQNILFVLPFLPYPMESGGHQALYNGIAAIHDDLNVFVAYQGDDDEKNRESVKGFLQQMPNVTLLPLLKAIHVETFKEKLIRCAKKYLKKVLRMENSLKCVSFGKIDCEWWKTTITPKDRDWLNHIHNACVAHNIGIVQIEMPWRIADVLAIPEEVKKVYVHHELGFVRRALEISKMESDVYAKACKFFADMNEVALLNLYDEIITLSPIDAQKLKNIGVKVPVYSSFAIVDSSKEILKDNGDGKRLTFIGPEVHVPNLVGITWFLDNCWNMLKERCPEMQLDIIGNWTEDKKTEYATKYKDVHFLGFVDNLYTAIKDSTMIVPITIGSGIRMKILEASSKGVPFVSTSVGAEGIPVKSGEDCFIADTPKDFVNAVLRLQDKSVRQCHIVHANNMVREHYSLEALRNNRLEIYGKLYSYSK